MYEQNSYSKDTKKIIYLSVFALLLIVVVILTALAFRKEDDINESSEMVSVVDASENSETKVIVDVSYEESFIEESSEEDVSSIEESSEEESFEVSEEISEEVSDPFVFSFPTEYINNNVTAKYSIVYDLTHDTIMYSHDADKKAFPASMTKLITAMIAVKYIPENAEITVGDEIKLIGPGSSTAWLAKGYRMNLETLLDAMLLPSGNDAAYVAAVAAGRYILNNQNASISASLEKYYETANAFVKSIGCESTHIACPDGFHDEDHYSTAYDFMLIGKEVVENYPLICKVVSKEAASDKLLSGGTLKFYNNNSLISETTFIKGLKTGFTDEAGYCMTAYAESDGRKVIVVTMFSSTVSNRYSDVRKLCSGAFGWY